MRHPPTSRLVPYAAAALVLYVACGPGTPVPRVDDDFSELCDGAPCGWALVEGEPEQARLVEGFHPGTYALRLDGRVGIQRERGLSTTLSERSRVTVELTLRCDQGEPMTATFSVVGGPDAGEPRRIASSVDVDAGWQRTAFVFETDAGILHSLTITKRGPASCDIGYVHVSTTRLSGTC